MQHLSGMDKLRTALHIQAKYLQLLVWPGALSCDYSLGVIEPVKAWSSPQLAVALLAALTVAVWALYALTALRRSGDAAPMLAFGWTFAPLVPASHVVDIGTVMAERLLFMPSVGVTMLLCHVLGARAGRVAPTDGATLLVVCAVGWAALRTVARVPDWADSATLFAADVATHPRSIKLNEMRLAMMGRDGIAWHDAFERDAFYEEAFQRAVNVNAMLGEFSDVLTNAPYASGLVLMASLKQKVTSWPEGANLTEALEYADQAISINDQARADTVWEGPRRALLATLLATKGAALTKQALERSTDPDQRLLKEAVASFRRSWSAGGRRDWSAAVYCDFGLALALAGGKEEAYEQYFEGMREYDRREGFAARWRGGPTAGDDVRLRNLENFGTLVRQIAGVESGDADAARTWGGRATAVIDKIVSHAEVSGRRGASGKWQRARQAIRALMEKPVDPTSNGPSRSAFPFIPCISCISWSVPRAGRGADGER